MIRMDRGSEAVLWMGLYDVSGVLTLVFLALGIRVDITQVEFRVNFYKNTFVRRDSQLRMSESSASLQSQRIRQ
jgi:hypothetical protein